VDTEGRFTFVNAAFETLTGYASADLLGIPSTHIYVPEAEALFLERCRQVQNNSAVPPYLETELLLKNGERLPVELSVSSLVIEGRITGRMAVVRRITAQKQTEAALQIANNELEQCVAERTAQLQEALEALLDEMNERQQVQEALFQREKLAALGELLANVAHELNNPLAVASMQVQNLQEEWGTGAWMEDFDILRQAIERCQSVIQSFLALVRQQTPTRHAIALNAVIDEALVLLGHSLEVDGIIVSLHLDEHLPPVWADANQLHHVIANLITNAHHALQQTSSSPRLTLTTAAYADRHQVILEVSDNGPGIPEDVQRRIFDPFFTTKPQGAGSGLGLPLCRNIVEGHEGTIQLISESGQGTTVRVTLPIAATGASSSEEPHTSDIPSQTQRAAILLIDDELSIQRALTRLLQRRGHTVTTATNGLEGLAALRERSYEVILCDMRMPDLDGPGFYRELEQSHPHLLLRVVFLTGDVLSPEALDFFNHVTCPCLTKPLRVLDIERIIAKMQESL
jgi:PAS domain S-box-containing protein